MRTTHTIPIAQVIGWTKNGHTDEQVATKLGITTSELYDSLESLKEKNRKSYSLIRQQLKKNGAKATSRSEQPNPEAEQSPKPAKTATVAVKPEPSPQNAEPKLSETEKLKLELQQAEETLQETIRIQGAAKTEISASREILLKCEDELKQLATMLRKAKETHEEQIERLRTAESSLIAAEGRKTELEKRIADLSEKLKKASKPEIYVCENGEITGENIVIPEGIDISNWVNVLAVLPEEIADNLRKKDATAIIRLTAIIQATGRDDCEIVFENSLVETAYAAYTSNN